MRIIFTGQSYLPGSNGQAVFTMRLAEGLARQGNDVIMIAPSLQLSAGSEMVNGVCIQKAVSLRISPVHPDTYLTLMTHRRIQRIFDEFDPDIVHLQDHYLLCRSVLKVARKRRVPVVGTNHFLPENILPYFPDFLPLKHETVISLLWQTMLSVYNQMDAVTTPTRTAAQILQQQPIHLPVQAISCGVDDQHFYVHPGLDRTQIRRKFNLSPTADLFIYVGRLDYEKRLDVMIRAFHRLGRENTQLVIGGNGAQRGELLAMVRQLDLGQKVVFTGYIPHEDLPLLLNSADIFVMPSPEELQSIATLEAMACGKPILAANARALPELVTQGVNGVLFRPNDVQDASRGMEALLEMRSSWEQMGKASQSRANPHSLTRTLQEYTELYRSLVAVRVPIPEESIPIG
ncbi:MAG: glycosyltransferase [Chloroflexi bacterium]|nr:glycosyltransferase [Chloroflexota bacterium]